MSHKTIGIKPGIKSFAWLDKAKYDDLYQCSVSEPDKFWAEQAKQRLDFIKPFSITRSGRFSETKWFEDATLNVSAQCIDRHLPDRAEQTAIIWEGDEPDQQAHISYQTLHDEVCRLSNVLRKYGVKKGDRVCIYLPMIVEAAYAMLACARIGAVHSVVFAGFSASALQARINDADCKVLITIDQFNRGGKTIALHQNINQAVRQTPGLLHVLMIENSSQSNINHMIDWQSEKVLAEPNCQPEEMGAEDPLFILYTSGSTGKPKGIVHTCAGYILYASMTHQYVFDYHENNIYWCTADVGWITGHSYIIYGPLANAATSLMFAGTPTYPTPARFWQIIDKHKVNIFYTAPTAIRTLLKAGDQWVNQTQRDSLRILGSVGEPINPGVWLWYHDVVGKGNCAVIDTWWQTETGGIMLSPMPGVTRLKPGFAQSPFLGILPTLLDSDGNESKTGNQLAIKKPWPGMARTIFNDHDRYQTTYFAHGCYLPGDEALQDQDGDFQVTGRLDDVLNVSGHRLGTAEVENAIVSHPNVAESAVVSMQHDIKGEAIYAFVTLKSGTMPSADLKGDIINTVRNEIGPIATPEHIQWSAELPKTRSGKIMRRVLRKIANRQYDSFGDLSTLADQSVVSKLQADRETA